MRGEVTSPTTLGASPPSAHVDFWCSWRRGPASAQHQKTCATHAHTGVNRQSLIPWCAAVRVHGRTSAETCTTTSAYTMARSSGSSEPSDKSAISGTRTRGARRLLLPAGGGPALHAPRIASSCAVPSNQWHLRSCPLTHVARPTTHRPAPADLHTPTHEHMHLRSARFKSKE